MFISKKEILEKKLNSSKKNAQFAKKIMRMLSKSEEEVETTNENPEEILQELNTI